MKIGVRGRLFAISLLLIVGVGLVTGAFFESRLRDELRARVEAELLVRARTAAAALARADDLTATVARLGETTSARVTVFGEDGAVLADSAEDDEALTSSSLPEVRRALAGEVGLAHREGPEGRDVVFVAVPYDLGGRRQVVRLAVDERNEDSTIATLRQLMMLAALVGLGIAVFMSGVASELMARAFRGMVESAVGVATGEVPGGSVPPAAPDHRLGGSLGRVAADLEGAVTELAAERDQIETILERMTDAVLALDADDRITIANTAAFELLDFDDDDVGRPLLEAVRLPVLLELAGRALEEEDAAVEFEVAKPPFRQVSAKAAPLKTMGGVVIVMHDVTEVRRLERMRRDFVANVSHELRTPIAVIRANAETLIDGALDDSEQARRFVDAMHRNAERLGRLIADLLDLSRIEVGQYSSTLEPLEVEAAIDTILQGLETQIRACKMEIVEEIEPDLQVVADALGFSQVMQNLLDNAIKYTPEGGQITVRARRQGDVARLEVEDDGPGIEPHHRKRVFERFYRVDTGRSRQMGGTGLGLSIVKHLTEHMLGRVGVEPAPRRGTIFWVELPLATEGDGEETTEREAESEAEPASTKRPRSTLERVG